MAAHSLKRAGAIEGGPIFSAQEMTAIEKIFNWSVKSNPNWDEDDFLDGMDYAQSESFRDQLYQCFTP